MYTDEQIRSMEDTCRNYNYFFGYASHTEEGRADENTTFFNYDGEVKHDEALLESLFQGYKKVNE